MLKLLIKYTNNKKGFTGIYVMLFMFVFVIASGLLLEWVRDNSIKENMGIHLSRAVNIAVDLSMMDEYRRERISKLDTDKARAEFYDYLKDELRLNDSMVYNDGKVTYKLRIDKLQIVSEPPKFEVEAVVEIDPFLFKDMLAGLKVEIPVSAKARNERRE